MDDDWDLHAVVRRGCTGSSASSTCSFSGEDGGSGGGFRVKDDGHHHPFVGADQVKPTEGTTKGLMLNGGMHEAGKPLFPRSNPVILQSSCISPISSLGEFSFDRLSWFKQHPHTDMVDGSDNKNTWSVPGSAGPCMATSQPSRSKRRKNQLKKVCHVPAESLTSDVWAWRKYGQKPIKGSPYPRGYYRCSSSKGCLARKQLERDKTDPGMFIVTYTAEHNHPAPTHRNSLAGSTRQKPAMPQGDSTNDTENKTPFLTTQALVPASSPATSSAEEEAAHQKSMNTESLVDDEEEGDIGLSGMVLSDADNICGGLEGGLLGDDNYEDCFLDQFPANFGRITWNDTAAAAGRS